MSLTTKEQLFCDHYLQTFNGADSVRKARYKTSRPDAKAYDLLRKIEVREYLAAKTAAIFKQNDIDVQAVAAHIISMAFFDITDLYDDAGNLLPIREWPEAAGRIVTSIKTEHRWEGSGEQAELVTVKEIKTADRVKTTEMLGRYHAMFTDNIRDVSDPKKAVVVYVPGFLDDSEVDDGNPDDPAD